MFEKFVVDEGRGMNPKNPPVIIIIINKP